MTKYKKKFTDFNIVGIATVLYFQQFLSEAGIVFNW